MNIGFILEHSHLLLFGSTIFIRFFRPYTLSFALFFALTGESIYVLSLSAISYIGSFISVSWSALLSYLRPSRRCGACWVSWAVSFHNFPPNFDSCISFSTPSPPFSMLIQCLSFFTHFRYVIRTCPTTVNLLLLSLVSRSLPVLKFTVG
jgi:hypothetical protein